MFLRLGDIDIANSDTDARVCALAVAKPSLSLPNHEDLDIIGVKCPVTISRGDGIAFNIGVTVTRQFANYGSAELFAVRHIAQMSQYTDSQYKGVLTVKTMLNKFLQFKDAVLVSAEIANEVGINTDIKYQFKTGEILANSTAILVGGNVLSVSDFAVTINEPF